MEKPWVRTRSITPSHPPIDGPEELGATGAAAGLSLDEDSIAQVVLTNYFGRDEYVVLRGGVGALGFAQEAESLAGNFDDALGIGRLGRRAVVRSGHRGDRLGKFIGSGSILLLAALPLIILFIGGAIPRTIIPEGATVAPGTTIAPARPVEVPFALRPPLGCISLGSLLLGRCSFSCLRRRGGGGRRRLGGGL